MLTLIASPYFPPYAIYYPSLLLVLGLVFAFWLALAGVGVFLEMIMLKFFLTRSAGHALVVARVRTGCAVGLSLLLAGGLIRGVTARNWPGIVSEYRQVMEQDNNRRRLYAEIVRLYNATGQRRFVLVNLWNSPVWGIHMDEVWSMAAYFRWRRMEEVRCVAEQEWISAGRPADTACYKLDCAEVLEEK